MDPKTVFAGIPESLRGELLDSYSSILRNFREGRWEPSELNGGKLCEIVHTILRGHIDGSFPKRASKPSNMVDACKAFEKAASFPRSVRIQIPRMLIALYEVRNNRGVGHTGGDVNPNHMDARYVLESAKWLMAELVRVFHDLDIQEATEVVASLVERTVPVVWTGEKIRRVLKTGLSKKDETLLLLYSVSGPVLESDLCKWVEHSNPSTYRRDVLKRAHKQRLVEYDQDTGEVQLLPTGVDYVEENLPLEF